MNDWIQITDFPRYSIAPDGRVINSDGRLLKPQNHHGSAIVQLHHDGHRYRRSIRTLVAQTHGITLPARRNRGNFKHGLTSGLLRDKPDKFYTVYALIDPRDFDVFYVGITKFPRRRYAAHVCPSTWDTNTGRYQDKMRELARAGYRPWFGILETTTDSHREAFHIRDVARLGYDLVNYHKTGKYKTPNYSYRPKSPKEPTRIRKRAARAAEIAAIQDVLFKRWGRKIDIYPPAVTG